MARATPSTPDPADEQAARQLLGQRIAAVLCLVGSLTSYIGAFTLHMSTGAQVAQVALAVGFTAIGVALAMTRPRTVVTHTALLWAVLAISVMLATADSFGTTPFFYLWPAVFAAYFCTTRFLIITLLAMTTTLGAALVISPIAWAIKTDTFIGVNLSVGLMAAVVAIMHSREERLNRRLAEAAHTDPLTGLLNRRGFDPLFEVLIDEHVAGGRPVSIVMFDLDHFKRFNDEHGHFVGDDALRRTAAILDRECRDIDVIARLGGEEFAVVLPGASVAVAKSYAERVAWALGTEDVDDSLRVSTSSGIGSLAPGASQAEVASLLLRADEALYAAKAGGRGRAAWWDGANLEIGDEIDVPAQVRADSFAAPTKLREYVLRPHERDEARRVRKTA